MFKKVVALFCAAVMIVGTAIPTFAVGSPTTIYSEISNSNEEGAAVVSEATPKEGSLTATVIGDFATNKDVGDGETSFYNAVKDTVEALKLNDEEVTIDGNIEDLRGKTPIETEPFSHQVDKEGTMTFAADSFNKENEAPVIVVIDNEGKAIGIYKITFDEEKNCWTVDVKMKGFFTIAA